LYPNAVVQGHRDFPKVTKACPSFDAKAWAKANGF
jgi:N-acetylmuramoyl-L-alanine amidase